MDIALPEPPAIDYNAASKFTTEDQKLVEGASQGPSTDQQQPSEENYERMKYTQQDYDDVDQILKLDE